jgi:hypothetical protein|tara:strand:- start:1363 stop:1824 length:462 start_codon:yes stop_codon:yes gene_type:complete
MKIPPKPKRGKRSPFYWWRRWKSHQYLPIKKGLLARIKNGDFEYPELFEWAKYELHYMKEEHDAYKLEYMNYNTVIPVEHSDGYMDIEKRYRKRYNKLFEDAYEAEYRHLTGLVEALSKKFKVSKDNIKAIMETFGGTTEELYIYVEQNKYTI